MSFSLLLYFLVLKKLNFVLHPTFNFFFLIAMSIYYLRNFVIYCYNTHLIISIHIFDSSCLFNVIGASSNEYDCYQIYPEISCDGEKVEPKCLTFCRKMFGARADGRCITGSPGLICACYYPC